MEINSKMEINEKKKYHFASLERLFHFRCGSCQKWWSIGDAPKREYWYCPWCGEKLTVCDKDN